MNLSSEVMVIGSRRLTFTYITIDKEEYKEYWFLAKDICDFLGYKKARNVIHNNVDSEYRLSYRQLENLYFKGSPQHGRPCNWQKTSIFIIEQGVYQLILKSNKKEAKIFYKHVFEALVTLRRQANINLKKQLTTRLSELKQITDIAQSSIPKPPTNDLQQVLNIFELEPGVYVFNRSQRRSSCLAEQRLRRQFPETKKLFTQDPIPHGLNILPNVKLDMQRNGEPYIAKSNRVIVDLTEEQLMDYVKPYLKIYNINFYTLYLLESSIHLEI